MSIYDTLNEQQKKGVFTTEGPVLILAGAGSGKTRVITHRIAYLIEEMQVNPWNIMAITFTNKAAAEMRERIDKLIGFGSESIWVSTFHSSCVRILRRFIDRLGYDNNFTIYDTDDQKTVMKEICKRLNIDTKKIKEKAILSIISSAKNEMLSPEQFRRQNEENLGMRKMADAYKEYQEQLKKNNALDFDDLLVLTVKLFQENPDVLEKYQERFKYIMVDEYQDTNTVQFNFVSLLARKYRNLCVVGDDDQSIYKFRGANIANILNFEELFDDTTVIKLEQNYRSKANILNAANRVIANNRGRKAKSLWTDKEDGEPIHFFQYENNYDEAQGIASDIKKNAEEGKFTYHQCACLYRTNAQSRVLEERLIALNIPYKLFGGVNFYARKEVKDMLAYLKTVDNGRDDVAVKRIINIPKRGIGLTTINRIQAYADRQEISFFDALLDIDNIPGIGRAAGKIREFTNFIRVLRSKLGEFPLIEIMDDIIDGTGYVEELRAENTEEAKGRIENIDELVSKLADYETGEEQPTLSGFLEEVALVADIDNLENNSDYVVLMTIHSAKGLEFPKVYLCGMEEGLFPSYMSIQSEDPTDIEEERRLCYVAVTRAMESITISCAKARMQRGEVQYNKVSRFVREIPSSLLDNDTTKTKSSSVSAAEFIGNTVGANMSKPNPYQAARRVEKTKPYEFLFDKPMYGTRGDDGFGSSSASAGLSGTGKSSSGISKSSGENQKSMSAADLMKKGLVKKGFGDGVSGKKNEAKDMQDTGAYGLGYNVGDKVRHIKFGTGTVLSISDAGRDYEVSVNFQNAGVKKMFASFAKLKKTD